MRADLVRDHDRPPSSSRHDPGSTASSGRLARLVSLSAAQTTLACRRSPPWVLLRTGRFVAARGVACVCFVCRGIDLSPILIAREIGCARKPGIRWCKTVAQRVPHQLRKRHESRQIGMGISQPHAPWRRPTARTSMLESQASGPHRYRSDYNEKQPRPTS
jgi:hypothetical protein